MKRKSPKNTITACRLPICVARDEWGWTTLVSVVVQKRLNCYGSGGGGIVYYDWYAYNIPGGNGGGLVSIKANTLDVEGRVVADGTNGGFFYDCGGGGSGGGIRIDVGTLSGSGMISTKGGASSYCGGGGGRIAIYYDTLALPTGNIAASGVSAAAVLFQAGTARRGQYICN